MPSRPATDVVVSVLDEVAAWLGDDPRAAGLLERVRGSRLRLAEIEAVGRALATANANMAELYAELEQAKDHEVEAHRVQRELVAQATARHRELRAVLDGVAEGLLACDLSGALAFERSRALDGWFGAPRIGDDLFRYFGRFAPTMAKWLELAFESLREGAMPAEVVLEQIPRAFASEGRHFELECRAIAGSAPARILVVVREVTSRVEGERAARSRELVAVALRRILEDRAGWREFATETERLLAATADDAGHALHTLKGNASLFGLDELARVCHELEDRLQGAPPSEEDRARLRETWAPLAALWWDVDRAMRGGETIEVFRRDLDKHVAMLAAGVPHDVLSANVHAWSAEPASQRLERLAERTRALARRLGKGDVVVTTNVSPPELRLPEKKWSAVWTAVVHLVRNALDHGIEPRPERAEQGKAGAGAIRLALSADDRVVELTVSDDGRGIRWPEIAARARRLGLPAETGAELEAALFATGVSSRDVPTPMSGRGLGMGAVRDAVDEAGGTVAVTTRAGRGTAIRLRFPRAMLG